jgi:hypothetical protein
VKLHLIRDGGPEGVFRPDPLGADAPAGEVPWMTTALDDVTSKKAGPTAEAEADCGWSGWPRGTGPVPDRAGRAADAADQDRDRDRAGRGGHGAHGQRIGQDARVPGTTRPLWSCSRPWHRAAGANRGQMFCAALAPGQFRLKTDPLVRRHRIRNHLPATALTAIWGVRPEKPLNVHPAHGDDDVCGLDLAAGQRQRPLSAILSGLKRRAQVT